MSAIKEGKAIAGDMVQSINSYKKYTEGLAGTPNTGNVCSTDLDMVYTPKEIHRRYITGSVCYICYDRPDECTAMLWLHVYAALHSANLWVGTQGVSLWGKSPALHGMLTRTRSPYRSGCGFPRIHHTRIDHNGPRFYYNTTARCNCYRDLELCLAHTQSQTPVRGTVLWVHESPL